MHSVIPKTGRGVYFTVRQVAWLLGVETSTVSRAIRTGTVRTVPRRGRLMIPSAALTPLLGPSVTGTDVRTAKRTTTRGRG